MVNRASSRDLRVVRWLFLSDASRGGTTTTSSTDGNDDEGSLCGDLFDHDDDFDASVGLACCTTVRHATSRWFWHPADHDLLRVRHQQ
jgi:hypothetical protein